MSMTMNQKFILLAIALFVLSLLRMFLIECAKNKSVPFLKDFMYSINEFTTYIKNYKEKTQKDKENEEEIK